MDSKAVTHPDFVIFPDKTPIIFVSKNYLSPIPVSFGVSYLLPTASGHYFTRIITHGQ